MKERLKKAAIVCALAGAACIATAAVYIITGFSLPCVFHKLTGLKCPGCGNTTAVLAMLRFDFAAAIRANCFMPAEFAYIGYAALDYTVKYVKTGKKEIMPKPEWLNVMFLVLLIIWSVGRNILGC